MFIALRKSFPSKSVIQMLLRSYPGSVNIKHKGDYPLHLYVSHAHYCDPDVISMFLRLNNSYARLPSHSGGNIPLYDMFAWKEGESLKDMRFSLKSFKLLEQMTPLPVISRVNFSGYNLLALLVERRLEIVRICNENANTSISSVKISSDAQNNPYYEIMGDVNICLRQIMLLYKKQNSKQCVMSPEMLHVFRELNYIYRRSALLVSISPYCRNNIFAELRNTCVDCWKEVLSYL